METPFINPDGTPWTPTQIQLYYRKWNQYYASNSQKRQQLAGAVPFTTQGLTATSFEHYHSSQVDSPQSKSGTALKGFVPATSASKDYSFTTNSENQRNSVKDEASNKQNAVWPESLRCLYYNVRNYVSRTFSCSDESSRPYIENKLKEMITKAMDNNTIWSTDWDLTPLIT